MSDDWEKLQKEFENRTLSKSKPYPTEAVKQIAKGNLLTGAGQVRNVTLHGKPTGEILADYTRRMRAMEGKPTLQPTKPNHPRGTQGPK